MNVKSEKEVAKAKADGETKLNSLYDSIMALVDDTVMLFDRIEDYFFQDIDYQVVQGMLSLWMSDAGRSPESSWDRILYDKVRQIYNDPMTNRILHWYDVQNILSAFQDRIKTTAEYLHEVFRHIPAYCLYEDTDYTGATRNMGNESDQLHTSINIVFVSLSSAFDLFTKVVYECAKFDLNGFASYNRLKSRKEGILYARKNYGFDELKEPGLLYDEPACIRTICSFRDEFIHCGSWDYRCAVYTPHIDGEPVEPFIPMPDVEHSGVLVSSGSRNKFYAFGTKINTALPALVSDTIEVLIKTEKRLEEVLLSKTTMQEKEEKEKAGMEYMLLLARNSRKLESVFKTK